MQVKSVWGYHLIIVWTLKLTAFALCDKTNEVYRYHSIHATLLYLYHFRDRSIPELDEILDAKLSEVQDHMRTLMQKQVGMFQPLYFLVLFCCSSGYLFLGVTGAEWTIWMWFECECNEFLRAFIKGDSFLTLSLPPSTSKIVWRWTGENLLSHSWE